MNSTLTGVSIRPAETGPEAKVRVVDVKLAPAIGKPQMQQGIRSKEAAEKWGRKNG